MIKVKSWDKENEFELLNCPFCGGEPEIIYRGNDFSNKPEIIIKCTTCRIQRTDASIKNSFIWLEKVSANNWNKRIMVLR